jgi:hypothetical protein
MPAWLCLKANKLAVSACLAHNYLQMLLATSQKQLPQPQVYPATAATATDSTTAARSLCPGCAGTLAQNCHACPQHGVFVSVVAAFIPAAQMGPEFAEALLVALILQLQPS